MSNDIIESFDLEVVPRLSQLTQDLEIRINIGTIKDLTVVIEAQLVLDIVNTKKEVYLAQDKQKVTVGQNAVVFRIDCGQLEQYDSQELLNVSLLKINVINKDSNVFLNKTLMIQFMKEKGIIYKNII